MSLVEPPRLRMFAGPNGSGKTSIIRKFSREFSPTGLFRLHRYINADDLQQNLRSGQPLPLGNYGGEASSDQLLDFLAAGSRVDLVALMAAGLRIESGAIVVNPEACDGYLAASIADFLRATLLGKRESFSFETVMSHPSKVDFISQARQLGYRTYLYFVATSDPALNVHRIETRTEQGGHAVPEAKVFERYQRSLALLPAVLAQTTRAFLFDNSGFEPVLVAEKFPDGTLQYKVPITARPAWLTAALITED